MFERALQLVVNGLMAGSILMLPAIGFTSMFAVLRFPNFALAAHMTIGAFAGFVANTMLGLPAVAALGVAFLVAGLVGIASDAAVLRKLRPAGALTVAIASIALNIVLENVVRFCFGNELHDYDLPLLRDWTVGGLRIGPQQLQNTLLALGVMAAVFLFLGFTRTGKAMRAVADNPTLASLKGVDPERVARLISLAGMGLAGIGGMLLGLDTSIDPLLGFRAILSVFAAAVVGGLGSIPGAVVGAFAIGVAEELSLLALPSTYRSAVGFVAILVFLTFRPRGLLGERAV
jgi:branched-chain amino acid transport system permease protein/neutral amino acid transport system permease protein